MKAEPAAVVAGVDVEGNLIPLRFHWHGQTYPVIDHGRKWHDSDGMHHLVMTEGSRTFELILSDNGVDWSLCCPPGKLAI